MDRWEIEKKVVLKALKDPEFKKKLIDQPKTALKNFLKNEKDVDLAKIEEWNLKVHEEKKDEWTISIPYFSNTKVLTDTELRELFAAGGKPCSLTDGGC